jgi:hypothetical protein
MKASLSFNLLVKATVLVLLALLLLAKPNPVFGDELLNSPRLAAPMVSTDPIDPGSLSFSSSDEAFYNLWIQQNNDNYSVKEGSSAFGKLIQLGFKATYKSFRDKGHISKNMPDENLQGKVSTEMKYRIRLESDSVRFGLKYKF